MSEKSALSGAAFSSPTKRYKMDRKRIALDDFNTEALVVSFSPKSTVYAVISVVQWPSISVIHHLPPLI